MPRPRARSTAPAVVLVLALVLGACGDGTGDGEVTDAGTSDAAAAPSATATSTSTPEEDPVGFDEGGTSPTATAAPSPTTTAPSPAPSVEAHPVTMTWDGIDLRVPSAGTELVGFHQSNNDGARDLDAVSSSPVPTVVLESRERGTGRRSAADVVVDPDDELRAPVTGTVVRAGTYTLYCDTLDDFAVIEPEGRPGIEVKMLHIDGVQVQAGRPRRGRGHRDRAPPHEAALRQPGRRRLGAGELAAHPHGARRHLDPRPAERELRLRRLLTGSLTDLCPARHRVLRPSARARIRGWVEMSSTCEVPAMSSMRHLTDTRGAEWARRGIAVFLVLHGIAHLVGAQAAIEAVGGGERVSYLFGVLDVGGAWASVLAVAWVAAAAGCAFAAAWLWTHHVRWWDATVVVLGFSLVLSIGAMPQAIAGVVIDVVLLVVAFLVRRDALDDVRW